MATVEFECPNPDCHQMLNVPEAHVGRPARCPMCKMIVRVRPPAGPGRRKLSPLEEQVGQWIGARADELEDIPDPESIRRCDSRPYGGLQRPLNLQIQCRTNRSAPCKAFVGKPRRHVPDKVRGLEA